MGQESALPPTTYLLYTLILYHSFSPPCCNSVLLNPLNHPPPEVPGSVRNDREHMEREI